VQQMGLPGMEAPSVPATPTPPITPPVGTQPVGGGTALPTPRPPTAGREAAGISVEGVEPVERVAPDVVAGAEPVEPALKERPSSEILDEVVAIGKEAVDIVNETGAIPAEGTAKRRKYEALKKKEIELTDEYVRAVNQERQRAATAPAVSAPQATPTVAATTTAPTTPTPPTAAGAGTPPVPPTQPPTGAAPSGVPQPPPGRPIPTSPTGQSSIGVLPNATTPNYLNTVGSFVRNLLPLSRERYVAIRALLDSTRITDAMRGGVYMFLSLPQKVQLFSNELPSLRNLLNVLNVRASSLKARKEDLD